MKTTFSIILFLYFGLINLNAQDLWSCTTCWITPAYSYNSSTHEVSIDEMVVANQGYFDCVAFDVAIFIIDVNTSLEYEIDRVNYSGLSYKINQNSQAISGWKVDLDNKLVPSGTYRVQVRINDNKSAYETSYINNIEYFGNSSFSYTSSSSSGIKNFNNVQESVILLYPNPSSGIFTLNLENTNGYFYFEITNINGQVLYNENVAVAGSTYNSQFDLSKYSKGIYYLRIIGENNETMNKMIIRE